MASIEKRGTNSYRITVSAGRTLEGKQIIHKLTYKPISKTPSAIKREVEKQAALFEAKVQNGTIIPPK